MRWILVLLAFSLHGCGQDQNESLAKAAGKQAGQFGAGVGEAVMEPMMQGLLDNQPTWETVPPRPKEDCLAETGGVVNEAFVRCRNGRQEYVRIDSAGNRKVLQERSIPVPK